jgi:hypothetical protein
MLLALAAALLTAAPVAAAPTVGVVVGPDAPKLERLAADELVAQFKQLFDAEAAVSTAVPAAVDHLILVGSPATNPAVAKAVGDRWPKLTEQGHVLRSVATNGRPALVVGGGSPAATLWAAAELGHRFGVRSFLHGDVMPADKPDLKLDGIDVTLEPAVRVRAWQVLGTDAVGFGGWGLADHKLLLKQLAKLKFNRVVVAYDTGIPAKALDGGPFPVAGDTPGRKAFKGAKEFDNPHLAGKAGEERNTAAEALVKEITAAARDLGMTTDGVPAGVQTITLTGVLPRVPTAFAATPRDGFLVAATVPGDLGPTAYYLARRAFDPKLTPKAATEQLFTPLLGAASAGRVALAFTLLDEANALVAKNDPKFLALAPGLLAKEVKSADAPPAWWKEAGKRYAGAMDEMYRGIRATFHDQARPLLLYYAKRCEFAVHYFAAVEAARLAGQAKAKGEKDAVVTHLEKAIESTYNALTALGDVARDPADRGLIAVLAEFAYRPLKAELKAADKAKEP